MIRFFVLLLFGLSSCYRASVVIEPCLPEASHPKEIAREKRVPLCLPEDFSSFPFASLTEEERGQDWGKEYLMALCFAEDFDLYRAISTFKRALFFLPEGKGEREVEIEYMITLSYFLGKKYVEVIYEVESSALLAVDNTFPPFYDLLVMLYDSYEKMGRYKERDHILSLIEKMECETSERLTLYQALLYADFPKLYEFEKKKESVEGLLCCYETKSKSVRKAEMLNALLPGAGYWYVGQKETAITAFLINALFISAAALFFYHDNIPASLITLSLESGWYFGGIYGGGLAAKYYNERLFEECAVKVLEKEKLYPLMMLRYTF